MNVTDDSSVNSENRLSEGGAWLDEDGDLICCVARGGWRMEGGEKVEIRGPPQEM